MTKNFGVILLALIGEIMFPFLSVIVVISNGNRFLSFFMIFIAVFLAIAILLTNVDEKPLKPLTFAGVLAFLIFQTIFSLLLNAILEELAVAKYGLFVFSSALMYKLILDYFKGIRKKNK